MLTLLFMKEKLSKEGDLLLPVSALEGDIVKGVYNGYQTTIYLVTQFLSHGTSLES